jgi:transglutaminase-like putative cysteine protease
MTQRPRLSDQVVLTVRSELVSFWRSAVYDQWDGTTWTRSDRGAYFRIPPSGEVLAASTDVAGQSGRRTTQQFRIEAGAAVSMPVAASPVAVSGLDDVAQSIDGELVSLRGLGRGATYRVTSRQVPVVPDVLRAASPDDVPEDVLDRYAARPVATPRVRELAREVTRGATNDYDRVLALIGWMDANTRYSLDAPLAPDGVDVVDHFLFDSQLGWCEQIASSLVVMLREVGVPARLATGYVPGEWDPVGGRFVVRERDAHAWAEVWFAGAGWVPFDPTADVPLAGEPDADAAELPAGAGALGVALLAVALVAVSVRPLLAAARSLQRRASDRLRRRRLARRHWDVAAEQRLERLGRRAGRPRGPGDTVPAHAAELAERCADRRLVRVGELLDAARYGPGDVAEEDRRFVDEVLDEVGPT